MTRIVTEYGVRATPNELRELVRLATGLAVGGCLSVLPPGTAQPEHVAHLTSLQVIAAEMRLRDLLTSRTSTTSAHTLLSEALDASGVYVGMTRGRDENVLHIVADNLDEAREHFIDALRLDRADRGLQQQPQ